MGRIFLAALALIALAGCENLNDIERKPRPIGEFSLAHNIVVAPNLTMGPASREASKEDWIAAVKKAVDDRFRRYDGDQHYHFGISVDGYVLAQPGLPLVLSPKSVLIIKLTVWDDATGTKLNEEAEQITALESVDEKTIVGSGLTKSPEEQMEALAFNAAKLIQRYITREHMQKQWFKRKKGTPLKPKTVGQEGITPGALTSQPLAPDAATTVKTPASAPAAEAPVTGAAQPSAAAG